MIKRSLLILLGGAFFITLNAFDVKSAAKDIYAKAGGNKTESQWTRYFSSPRWQEKLGITSMSDSDKSSLLSYLNKRSADKDQATVPQ